MEGLVGPQAVSDPVRLLLLLCALAPPHSLERGHALRFVLLAARLCAALALSQAIPSHADLEDYYASSAAEEEDSDDSTFETIPIPSVRIEERALGAYLRCALLLLRALGLEVRIPHAGGRIRGSGAREC